MPRARTEKLGAFLEAAYCLETDDAEWLATLMRAAQLVWGRSGPMHGGIYDASDVTNFRVSAVHMEGFSEEGRAWVMGALERITPGLVVRAFRRRPSARIARVAEPEMTPMLRGVRDCMGFTDAFTVNGVDPSGRGVIMAFWFKPGSAPRRSEWSLYRRMAHHVAAAHRCRQRLRESPLPARLSEPIAGAEAIVDGHGRLVHASESCVDAGERAAIVESARARERAMASKTSSASTLESWTPLTRARWTLLDHFERNGVRYVVARENRASVPVLGTLSERELQVLAYVAMGQSTKETAYALGIATATVRVLVTRIMVKFAVRNRAALLEHPEVRSLRT